MSERLTSPVSCYIWNPCTLFGWIGSKPNNNAEIHDDVLRKKLKSGIEVRVLRSGVLMFDFSHWKLGEPVKVIDYPKTAGAVDAAVTKSHQKAELQVLNRTSLLNAYLACFCSAMSKCDKRASIIQQEIKPQDHLSAPNLETSINKLIVPHENTDIYRLLQRFKEATHADSIVTLEALETFLQDLDKICELQFSKPKSNKKISPLPGICIAELLLKAVNSYSDHCFEISTILSWTIIEKMLNELWFRMINENLDERNEGRKRNLLESKQITVFHITEFLKFNGKFDDVLYQDLVDIRKARNNYMHNLHEIEESIAVLSIRAAQSLIEILFSIKISMPLGKSISY